MRVNAAEVYNFLAKLLSCTPYLSSCVTKNPSDFEITSICAENIFFVKYVCLYQTAFNFK